MNAVLSALVNGAIAGAVLALVLWLGMRLAPRRALNAATRYVIWWIALAATVALPLLYLPHRAAPVPHSAPATLPVAPVPFGLPLSPVPVSAPVPVEIARPAEVRIDSGSWTVYVFAIWAIVSSLLLLRLLIGAVTLARRSRRAIEVDWPLQSRRRIQVRVSREIPSPMAIGPWRPSILIPETILQCLDERELRRVILHEAAHLARWDDVALLAQRCIEALFALHPVARWIGRHIDFEREIACDDVVLAATGAAREYAGSLVRMAELCGSVPLSLAGAAAVGKRSHLSRRVELLLERRRHTGTRLLQSRLVWTAAALGGVAFAASRLPAPVVLAEAVRAIARPSVRPVAAPVLALAQVAASATGFEARVLDDASGNPLPSAELRFHKPGQIELAADMDTDGHGRVAAPLPSGEYLMDVVKPNFVTTTMKVQAPATGVTVRLVRYGVIAGQVTDQQGRPEPGVIRAPTGRALGGTRIAILTRNEHGEFATYREATLDDDGRYRVYDLRPGQYAVALAYDGLKDGAGFHMFPDSAHPRIFTVTGGEEYEDINFVVTPAAVFDVSGRVKFPGNHKQYALSLALPDQPLFPVSQVWTDQTGSGDFHFTKVPAGTYDLFVAGPTGGYGARDAVVSDPEAQYARMKVNIGQNVQGLEVAVSPGRTLRVTLRSSEGEKLPEGCPPSSPLILDLMEPWGLMLPVRNNAVFGKDLSVPGLPPARYRVRAALGPNCYQAKEVIADLSGDAAGTAAIEVSSAGSVQGTVNAPNVAVVLLPEEGGDARVVFPRDGGRFAFDSLAPGRYRIAARPVADAKARWVGDVEKMQVIEVTGGKPAHVDLEVKK